MGAVAATSDALTHLPAPAPTLSRKRTREECSVDVLATPAHAVVRRPDCQLLRWQRLRGKALLACGVDPTSGVAAALPEPQAVAGEALYVVARTAHPFEDGSTVCLAELSRGRGYVLFLEEGLQPILGRVRVLEDLVQHDGCEEVAAALEVAMPAAAAAAAFRARAGQTGLLLGRAPHPNGCGEVCAVEVPRGGVAFLPAAAVRVLPVEVVTVEDPLARYQRWEEMEDALGVAAEARDVSVTVRKGMVGVVKCEHRHLSEPHTMVCAVELFGVQGVRPPIVLLDKRALRNAKY
eukprot:Rhum_TRINITY_DN11711_c0_g1::Rhum_TRINITY_DN11711_c0_g1_i1::g.46406::m.46406